MKEIKICMGSACFIKGNQENLQYLKNYISEKNLGTEISCIGGLCENKCDKGPRIVIDNVEYTNVTRDKLVEILNCPNQN